MNKQLANAGSKYDKAKQRRGESLLWSKIFLGVLAGGGVLWGLFPPNPEDTARLGEPEKMVVVAFSAFCAVALWGLARMCISAGRLYGQFRNPDLEEALHWPRYARGFFMQDDSTADATQRLVEKIFALYELNGMTTVFPVEQAKRLVEAHKRQWSKISAIDDRLKANRVLHREIGDNLEQLRLMGESNAAGERSLKELKQDESELLILREKIVDSSRKLEALLPVIETEWRKTCLHRETNRLAEIALRSTAEDSAVVWERTTTELEHQITFEINTYLKLESETQQRLDAS